MSTIDSTKMPYPIGENAAQTRRLITQAQLCNPSTCAFPHRYNATMLANIGRHAASSWQQSGHVCGRQNKVRSQAACTSPATAYALLIKQLSAALRAALQAARQNLVQVREHEVGTLAQTHEWQALDDAVWHETLRGHDLQPVGELHVETEQDLLATLDETPLSLWKTWAVAAPTSIQAAREEAVKLLEPKAVRVQPKSTTLHTPTEVETYLQDLRTEILQHIAQGNPVIL